jgi:hypothetical protein
MTSNNGMTRGLRPTVGPEFVSHYNIYGSALIKIILDRPAHALDRLLRDHELG